MRLVCPVCGAQYNVPDDAIPAAGRDVECSGCGHSWFESGITTNLQPEITEPPLPDERPIRRSVDASVAEILRQEAAREQQLRETEIKDDPSLAQPDEPDQPIAAEVAEERVEPPPPVVTPRRAPVVRPEPNPRDMPSMNEINASLRAQSRTTAPPKPTTVEQQESSTRHGFRRGFVLVLLIFALLLTPYIFADQIRSQVPQSQDILTAYVLAIDDFRLSLHQQVTALADWAAGMSG